MKRYIQAIAIGLFATLVLLLFTYYFSSDGMYQKVMEILQLVLAIVCTIALYGLHSRLKAANNPDSRVFRLMSVAFVFWILTELVWTVYAVFYTIPTTLSPADFLSFIGYIFFIFSIYQFYESSGLSLPSILEVLVTYVVIGLLVLFILENAIVQNSVSVESMLLSSAYALLDAIMLSLSVPIILRFLSSPTKYRASLIGIVIFFVAAGDFFGLYFSAQNNVNSLPLNEIFFVLAFLWGFVVIFIYPVEMDIAGKKQGAIARS